MKPYLSYLLSALCIVESSAQFAPAAGQPGSTALRHDSSCFVAWATACSVQRGYMDISRPDSGYATVGTDAAAAGPAMQNGVVSLGDAGTATLTFSSPITNGAGWDFAVFENTFLDSFLELAFVEVSSDGQRFVRFPAQSLTDTAVQTWAFGYTRPEKVNNLAGKYVVGYGTPFDLEEIRDSAGIDINSITHVRVVDVVGSMNVAYACRDASGRKINDPWPTLFPSSGFDLDAVGVIHQKALSRDPKTNPESALKLWPNPVTAGTLHVQSDGQRTLFMYNSLGAKIDEFSVQKGQNELRISRPTGMYYLIDAASGVKQAIFIKN